jgi:hypothetical protein
MDILDLHRERVIDDPERAVSAIIQTLRPAEYDTQESRYNQDESDQLTAMR